jgi:hypothetical protein
MYSAIVLNFDSREECLALAAKYIPNEVDMDEVIAHHMTINMGELRPEHKKLLNDSVEIVVDGFAFDDKVVALRVNSGTGGGSLSSNRIPHITIAVNRKLGGKPVMSNHLKNWTTISPVTVSGTIQEVN